MWLLFSDCGFDRDMAGFLLKMETLRQMFKKKRAGKNHHAIIWWGRSRHFDWAMAIIAMWVSQRVDNGDLEDFGVETTDFHIFHGWKQQPVNDGWLIFDDLALLCRWPSKDGDLVWIQMEIGDRCWLLVVSSEISPNKLAITYHSPVEETLWTRQCQRTVSRVWPATEIVKGGIWRDHWISSNRNWVSEVRETKVWVNMWTMESSSFEINFNLNYLN